MASWLEAALNYIDLWLDFHLQKANQPGCVVAVVQGGKLVHEKAIGVANVSDNTPLTARHLFRVASHSKTVAATAVLKLQEQGALRLSDAVGNYVTGLHPNVAAATIEQLLTHSAGLARDGMDSSYFADRRPFLSIQELMEELRKPPTISAGRRGKYSNYGYALLGIVIENVTKQRYADWITREILQPLHLNEMLVDYESSLTSCAQGHTSALPDVDNHNSRRFVIPGTNITNTMASVTGLVSSAADLARFFSQLSPAAKSSLLSKESRVKMQSTTVQDQDSMLAIAYGLGVQVGKIGDWNYVGNVGRFQGFVSRTVVLTDVDIAVALLINAIDGPEIQWLDDIVHIFQQFHRYGPGYKFARHWLGRWWNLWGARDFVPLGDQVYMVNPMQRPPFAEASVITLDSPDAGTITQAPMMDAYGETVERLKNDSGTTTAIRVGGAYFASEKQSREYALSHYGQENNTNPTIVGG